MGIVNCIRNFLKRLEKMEKTGKPEETVRGKFGRKGGLLSGAYEYLVRIGIKKKTR